MAETAGLLRERGLPLMLHANEPVGHVYPGKSAFGPEACVACAAAYPGLKLVFAHMGGGTFLYEAMPELRRTLADAYYDTSALPYLYDAGIYRAVEAPPGPTSCCSAATTLCFRRAATGLGWTISRRTRARRSAATTHERSSSYES